MMEEPSQNFLMSWFKYVYRPVTWHSKTTTAVVREEWLVVTQPGSGCQDMPTRDKHQNRPWLPGR